MAKQSSPVLAEEPSLSIFRKNKKESSQRFNGVSSSSSIVTFETRIAFNKCNDTLHVPGYCTFVFLATRNSWHAAKKLLSIYVAKEWIIFSLFVRDCTGTK